MLTNEHIYKLKVSVITTNFYIYLYILYTFNKCIIYTFLSIHARYKFSFSYVSFEKAPYRCRFYVN